MNTQEKLNRLYELRTAVSDTESKKQAEIDTILTPGILAHIEEIRKKWDDTTESMVSEIAELEAEIKADVLNGGETVKGDKLMATWNKGRVSWDGKLLDGMAKIIPQLETARKVGEPTVTIREVK